jgi:hypothetical protein
MRYLYILIQKNLLRPISILAFTNSDIEYNAEIVTINEYILILSISTDLIIRYKLEKM